MDSMYAQYLKEKTNDQILETEEGFATYRFLNEKQVYIVDLYVHPDFRKTKVASAMADVIVEAAKLRGCTELLGTVVPSTKNSTDSLRVLLGYGMRLDSSAENLIIFKKDI